MCTKVEGNTGRGLPDVARSNFTFLRARPDALICPILCCSHKHERACEFVFIKSFNNSYLKIDAYVGFDRKDNF